MLDTNGNELFINNFKSKIESMEQTILFYDMAIQSAQEEVHKCQKGSMEEIDIKKKIKSIEYLKKKEIEKINNIKNNYSLFDKMEFDSKIESIEQTILFYEVNIATLQTDILRCDNGSMEEKSILDQIELYKQKMKQKIQELNKYKTEYSPVRIAFEREMQALYGPPDALKKQKGNKYLRLYIETDDMRYKCFLLDEKYISFGRNADGFLGWSGSSKLLFFYYESPKLFVYNLVSDEIVTINDKKIQLKYKTQIHKGDIIKFEKQNLTVKISDIQFEEE